MYIALSLHATCQIAVPAVMVKFYCLHGSYRMALHPFPYIVFALAAALPIAHASPTTPPTPQTSAQEPPLVTGTGESLYRVTERTGHWIAGTSVDPYTAVVYPYASLFSASSSQTAPAVMNIQCGRHQTVVSVYWGQALKGDSLTVRYSVDNGTAQETTWSVSKDHRTMVYPADGKTLFTQLLAANSLSIEASSTEQPTLQANFDNQGAATALAHIVQVCGD